MMGLAEELGYSHRTAHKGQLWFQRMARTRSATAVIRIVQRPLDSLARRLTKGRSTVSDWVGGLPPLWLTSTGAKSGEPRETPLYGFPSGDDLGVLGTSYGQRRTPGWVYNLEVHPNATVRYLGTSCDVIARIATASEEEKIWDAAIRIYPGYADYRARAPNREIRVFVLELAANQEKPIL